MSLSFNIGRRFSRAKSRNHLISFISLSSMIGIAVGVAVIIIGLSAMNGFERELENRVISVIPQAQLVASQQQPLTEWKFVSETAEKHPEVIASAPYIEFTALLEKGSQLKAAQIRGVDRELEQKVSNLVQFIDQEAWQNLKPNEGQIILGKGIADILKVSKGDSLTIMIPPVKKNTDIDPSNSHMNQKLANPQRIRLTVVGLLSLDGQVDHNLALIPIQDAQQYLELGDTVNGVTLKVKDVFTADQIAIEVSANLPYYLSPRSWKQEFGYLYHDILLVKTIMYLVMFLVIGVASFNIVSTLMMAVKDRASDIAILTTMGAQKSLIRKIFIWYGVFSGLLGCIIGSIFGILVALNLTPIMKTVENFIGHKFLSGDIYFIDFLPSQIMWQDVVFVSGTAIFLSLIATLYPASRASKLNPARVLSSK